MLHVLEPFQVCVYGLFVRNSMAVDSEVASQEAEHAVGHFCYPVYMRLPIHVVRDVKPSIWR